MSAFNIQWSTTSLVQLQNERYAQFFALVLHGELVFMGKAYREDLESLIPACIGQLDLDPLQLTLVLGRIREIGMGRITDEAVDGLLNLLVYARKPRLNRVGKYRYQGTLDMHLTNVGLELLPSKIKAMGNIVIVNQNSSASPKAEPLLAC